MKLLSVVFAAVATFSACAVASNAHNAAHIHNIEKTVIEEVTVERREAAPDNWGQGAFGGVVSEQPWPEAVWEEVTSSSKKSSSKNTTSKPKPTSSADDSDDEDEEKPKNKENNIKNQKHEKTVTTSSETTTTVFETVMVTVTKTRAESGIDAEATP